MKQNAQKGHFLFRSTVFFLSREDIQSAREPSRARCMRYIHESFSLIWLCVRRPFRVLKLMSRLRTVN